MVSCKCLIPEKFGHMRFSNEAFNFFSLLLPVIASFD